VAQAKRATVRHSTAKKSRAKRPTASKGRKKSATSSVTKQVRTTAMKVLQGAASGAVQALIPPLEEAAEASAKSAGTKKAAEVRSTKARK
jgi:hypothetical protein